MVVFILLRGFYFESSYYFARESPVFITALRRRDSASFLEFGTLSRSRKIQCVSDEIVSNKKIEAIDNSFWNTAGHEEERYCSSESSTIANWT